MYEVVKELGQGRVAALYEVRSPETGEVLLLQDFLLKPPAEGALERVPPIAWEALTEAIDPYSDAELPRRSACPEWFGREVRRVARWKHEAFPRIRAAGATDERGALILESGGMSLAALVERDGPMDEARAIAVVEQVLDALQALHGARPAVVLSDVRPSNLRLDAEGRVRFLTFGDTRFVEPPRRGLVLRASPPFTSPERRNNRQESTASDIWCVGGLLWFLLSGAAPGQGTLAAGEVTTRVAKRCLDERPEHRYKSVGEVRAALQGREPEDEDRRPPVLVVDAEEMLVGPVLPGTSVQCSFRVRNEGGGVMQAHVGADAGWITVNPADFESNDETVQLWADTEKLMPDNSHSSVLRVSCGKQVKFVRFTVKLLPKPKMSAVAKGGWAVRLLIPLGVLAACLFAYVGANGWDPILKLLRIR